MEVMTWSSSFNEAARACGLDSAAVHSMPLHKEREVTVGPITYYWHRYTGKVQVCVQYPGSRGAAIWTVESKDIPRETDPDD